MNETLGKGYSFDEEKPSSLSLRDFRVCAVVVTFNPDSRFFERLTGIVRQDRDILIVDNSTEKKSRRGLERQLQGIGSIHLISNRGNMGLAAALNTGMAWAVENGYRGVVTFDQDSESFPFQIDTLTSIYMSIPQKNKIALIGSSFVEAAEYSPQNRPKEFLKTSWRPVLFVITSGCFVPLNSYLKLGPFRREFFIDDVDNEYCLRARRHGYRILQSKAPLMRHTVGHPVTIRGLKSPLGRKIRTSGHSASRRYYMARNTSVLFREYFLSDPLPVLIKAYRLISALVYISLFESDKFKKLTYSFLGLWDGMRKKFGSNVEKRTRE